MMRDVSRFERFSVTDTCAAWNVLSSVALHRASIGAGCAFALTSFGVYECLHKSRKVETPEDKELQQRLRAARAEGHFKDFPLDVEDLQEVAILENRRRLGKGELAAIAFAKKTRQAFLTDDRAAQKLAGEVMEREAVQTTPHLLGWLVFTGRLGDSDIEGIVTEHERLIRPLKPHLMTMYGEGMRCRWLQHSATNGASGQS